MSAIDAIQRCRSYRHHRLSAVRAAIREDIVRFASFSPLYRPTLNWKTVISILLNLSLIALLIHRTGHYLYLRGWRRLARLAAALNLYLLKVDIPSESCIGPGFFLGHRAGSIFHGSAGRNLTMFSLAICCPGLSADRPAGPATLGDDVTIGGHAVVIGGIRVGNRVQIGPLTCLDRDCPDDRLAVSARMRTVLRPPEAVSKATEC